MYNDVSEWSSKPRFWCKHTVGTQKWRVTFGYDRRQKIGKIYAWVDKGTATHAGGTEYPIVPVRARALKFPVPNMPKTLPGIPGIGPAKVMSHGGIKQTEVVTKKVMHPGIRPRDFSGSMRRELAERDRPGSMKSVTDAAVKRAFRKISSALSSS